MTLDDLIDQQRSQLEDETVGVRRSWEETFKYTLKFYPGATPLEEFDLDVLGNRMVADGVNQAFAEGYIMRWRKLLGREAHQR